MKNYKILMFLFVLTVLGIPMVSYAYSSSLFPAGSSPGNPLYVEEIETPQQRIERVFGDIQRKMEESNNQMAEFNRKTNSLSGSYASDDYRFCYDRYCANKDLANPYTNKQCLSLLEYCLGTEAKYRIPQPSSCQTGYIYHNGECITYNALCQANYDSNTKFKEFNYSTNKIVCDCMDGYEWGPEGTQCIKNIEKINRICEEKYGEYAQRNYLAYQVESITEGECICVQPDYKFNEERTKCIKDEKYGDQQINKAEQKQEVVNTNIQKTKSLPKIPAIKNKVEVDSIKATTTELKNTKQVLNDDLNKLGSGNNKRDSSSHPVKLIFSKLWKTVLRMFK